MISYMLNTEHRKKVAVYPLKVYCDTIMQWEKYLQKHPLALGCQRREVISD